MSTRRARYRWRRAAANPIVLNDSSAQLLVALLRAQLGTAAAPGPEQFAGCDWEYFARLAAHHGVTPILYQGLRERADLVPAERLQQMRLVYHSNALRNVAVEGFVDEIAAALSAARIAMILLRGAALLRTLYDDPALRRVSDIDLLVAARDLDRAGAQLRALGLAGYGQEQRRGPLCRIHARYARPALQSIPVELHWRLFEGYQPYAFDLAEVRARVQSLPEMPPGVFAMSPEHELAYLCLHLERRAMVYRSLIRRDDWFDLLLMPQGLGRLVWLYDIALSLQQRASVLDWDALVAMARRWAIDAHLHAVFELCRRAFGVGPPPTVLAALHRGGPRLADRLAHRVLFTSRRALQDRAAGLSSNGTDWATALAPSVLRLAHTWSCVFPPPAYLRAMYPAHRFAVRRYARHLQAVAPDLWSEMRERFAGGAPHGESVRAAGRHDQVAWGTVGPGSCSDEGPGQMGRLVLPPQEKAHRARHIPTPGANDSLVEGAGIPVSQKSQELVDAVEKAADIAYKESSGLPDSILSMVGMSSPRARHFLNAICRGRRYIEVGTWAGSTLCAAMHGNKDGFGLSMDNESQFRDAAPNAEPIKALLARNMGVLSSENGGIGNVVLLNEDSSRMEDIKPAEPFDVFFYDGDHAEAPTRDAILGAALHIMAPEFILVVDDWELKPSVELGTRAALSSPWLETKYFKHLPQKDAFHIGLGVFVINNLNAKR
jgi:hypothetical protein